MIFTAGLSSRCRLRQRHTPPGDEYLAPPQLVPKIASIQVNNAKSIEAVVIQFRRRIGFVAVPGPTDEHNAIEPVDARAAAEIVQRRRIGLTHHPNLRPARKIERELGRGLVCFGKQAAPSESRSTCSAISRHPNSSSHF